MKTTTITLTDDQYERLEVLAKKWGHSRERTLTLAIILYHAMSETEVLKDQAVKAVAGGIGTGEYPEFFGDGTESSPSTELAKEITNMIMDHNGPDLRVWSVDIARIFDRYLREGK